uniref:Uncharacterized protein n=1 Tax=Anopheles maculatus TaxID=74869 RepID=A0A182SJJ5_9DIPT
MIPMTLSRWVECAAHIFDLYRHSTVALADENYPQVRVLSNSDNGVHFSFMSDKDEAPSSASASRSMLTVLRPDTLMRLLDAAGGWLFGTLAQKTANDDGDSIAVVDTGQTAGTAVGRWLDRLTVAILLG